MRKNPQFMRNLAMIPSVGLPPNLVQIRNTLSKLKVSPVVALQVFGPLLPHRGVHESVHESAEEGLHNDIDEAYVVMSVLHLHL